MRTFMVMLATLVTEPSFAQNQPAAPVSAPSQQVLTGEQLEALVSPIALYPDTLLSEVLMGSTYPLEVVEADQWAKANKNLQGDQLKSAVAQQRWDESIKSLVATPDVLDMMSAKLDWTQKLGDAVLAQQSDVMDAVQRLRQKAEGRGKLPTTAQQTVRTQIEDGKRIIAIEPTDPDTIYVPYYDPAVVYGDWPYSDYPPYYFGAPGYIGAGILATGLAFGTGYALGRWATNRYRWGGGFNWNNHQINPLRSVNNVNVGNWAHNPAHRGNVRYNNPGVAQRFGGNRGGTARQGLQPGAGNRRGAGVKGTGPGRGNANVGKRATNRASAKRPSNKRANTANRSSTRPPSGSRTATKRGASHARSAHAARAGAGRVHPGAGGARRSASLGGLHASARGGGFRGGGGGFRGGGGGRRSDFRLKHDITLVGRLDNGIGLYKFIYNGGHTAYVGVIAQEVQTIVPDAVVRGRDGYLRVFYEKLGLKFQTYNEWLATARSTHRVSTDVPDTLFGSRNSPNNRALVH